MEQIYIGWTTVEKEQDAQSLAKGLIDSGLAACVQIDGPITSYYSWKEKVEYSKEYRVTVKFCKSVAKKVEAWVQNNNPYELPQWIVVESTEVSESYLSWVHSVTKK